jgi:hypothetical protein
MLAPPRDSEEVIHGVQQRSDRQHSKNPQLVVPNLPQVGLDGVAQEICSDAHRRGPDGRADHIEQDELPDRDATHSEDKWSHDTDPVYEAEPQDQRNPMAAQDLQDPLRPSLPVGPLLQPRLTVAATQKKEGLIADDRAGKGGHDHTREREVAKMGCNPSQDKYGLTFEKGTKHDCRVAVVLNERWDIHRTLRPVFC